VSTASARRQQAAPAGVQVTIKTPVLDKMLANKAESQACGNFLNWLQEQGYVVARYGTERRMRETLLPVHDSIEQLLAKYFEVDLGAAERERCKILAAIR
jgi:hypothetical protein